MLYFRTGDGGGCTCQRERQICFKDGHRMLYSFGERAELLCGLLKLFNMGL